MPKVPVNQSLGLQPNQQARYSAQGTVPVQDQTPATLGRMGQAFSQAGQDWGRYAADVQRRADIAYTTERQTQAAEADLNDWSAYSQKTGKDAYDGFDAFRSTVQKRYEKLAATAENEQQRQWLKEAGQQKVLSLTERAMGHRDKEVAVWRIGTAKADTEQGVQEGIAAYGTPDEGPKLEALAVKQAEFSRLTGADYKQGLADQMAKVRLGTVQMLLNQPGRLGEAVAYWDRNKKDVRDVAATQKVDATLKALTIEQGAQEIAARIPDLDNQLRYLEANGSNLTNDDKDSAVRHLMQIDARRQDVAAAQANDVRKQILDFQRDNPTLAVEDKNPDLARRAAELNVVVAREVANPDFVAFMNTTEGQRDLQSKPTAMLENILFSNLPPERAKAEFKRITGDQSGFTIDNLTTALAIDVGVIPVNAERNKAGERQQALLKWQEATIAPLVNAASKKLGRPLNPREFQELIVNPIMQDKVMVETTTMGRDWLSKDTPTTVMAAQRAGLLPLDRDDPSTPGIDESAYTEAHQKVYVQTSKGPVYLREIPMQVRRDLRQAFQELHPGQQMTARQEAEEWVSKGRPGGPEERKRIAAKDDPTIRRYRDSQMGMSQDFWQKAVRNYREAKQ